MKLPRTRTLLQYVTLAGLFIIGTIAVLMILGEEAPESKLSLVEFFVLKILAGFALFGIYHASVWFKKHNLLPLSFIRELEDAKEEE